MVVEQKHRGRYNAENSLSLTKFNEAFETYTDANKCFSVLDDDDESNSRTRLKIPIMFNRRWNSNLTHICRLLNADDDKVFKRTVKNFFKRLLDIQKNLSVYKIHIYIYI